MFNLTMAMMRKNIPFWRYEDIDKGFREDIERIARTSPHLLADMGFVLDCRSSSDKRMVWRRNSLTVAIHEPSGPVCVHVSDAMD